MPATVTPNLSLLELSLRSLQLPTYQPTQSLPLVPLQETNQDGDQDIQSSQLQYRPQSTGLFHQPKLKQDHLEDPTVILNHSSPLSQQLELPQTTHLSQLIQLPELESQPPQDSVLHTEDTTLSKLTPVPSVESPSDSEKKEDKTNICI